MLNINATLLFQIINFIILIFVLDFILFKPILRMHEERERLTSGTRDESKQREEETERVREEYHKKVDEARLNGKARREQLKKEGLVREKEILENARRETTSALKDTQAQIEREMSRAREDIESHIQRIASQVARTILGREVS